MFPTKVLRGPVLNGQCCLGTNVNTVQALFKSTEKPWELTQPHLGAALRKSINKNKTVFTSQPGQSTSSRCDNHIVTVQIADNGWSKKFLFDRGDLSVCNYNSSVCLGHITDAKSGENKQQPVSCSNECKTMQPPPAASSQSTFNFYSFLHLIIAPKE